MLKLSPQYCGFEKGRRDYRERKPCPPKPDDDDPCESYAAYHWIGWRIALGEEFFKRRETLRKLDLSDEDDWLDRRGR